LKEDNKIGLSSKHLILVLPCWFHRSRKAGTVCWTQLRTRRTL